MGCTHRLFFDRDFRIEGLYDYTRDKKILKSFNPINLSSDK